MFCFCLKLNLNAYATYVPINRLYRVLWRTVVPA